MSDMTREEAIDRLMWLKDVPHINDDKWIEAVDMAIEALQTKTDGDLISRQDALKPFCIAPDGTRIPEVDCDNFPVEFSVEFIKKHLLSLPSAEPKTGEWIPCSERLPSEPFGCIVTVWDSTPTGEGDDFENILPYFVGWDGEQWNDEDGEKCPFEVIAWMPYPMPYREDGEA